MRKLSTNTILLAIVACLLWSSAFAGIKIGLQYIRPLQFAGIRFFLSGLYILPFCGGIIKSIKIIRKNLKTILLISFFQTFLLYALFYTGISQVPASITAIVIGGSPLFISILAHFMVDNDKMSRKKTLSILLGISGVVIIAISRGEFSWEKGQEFWGIIILIFANISGGVGNVLAAKRRPGISPLTLNAAQLGIGGIFLFILAIPIEGIRIVAFPPAFYISLGWLSFLSAAAFSIWFVLLQRPGVKVSELNIWKFIIPVFGAILSWIIIPGEHPEIIPIIGMVIISVSLILLNLKKSNR